MVRRRAVVRRFTQFEQFSGSEAVTIDEIDRRNDSINRTAYMGRDPYTLRLGVESAAVGIYYGVRCWRIDYRLAYKKDDWRLKQLDVGWDYRGESDERVPFLRDGEPYLGSLNGQGKPAPDDEPAMLYFKQYESIEFADFLRFHLA